MKINKWGAGLVLFASAFAAVAASGCPLPCC